MRAFYYLKDFQMLNNLREDALSLWLEGSSFSHKERLTIKHPRVPFQLEESLEDLRKLLPFIDSFDEYEKWREYLLDCFIVMRNNEIKKSNRKRKDDYKGS